MLGGWNISRFAAWSPKGSFGQRQFDIIRDYRIVGGGDDHEGCIEELEMPGHYNLVSFLRQLSRELLTELFASHAIDVGLDVSALKKRQIEPIFAAINVLPDDQRCKLDEDFQNIAALATQAGITHIIDEARFGGIEIIDSLRPIRLMLDRAAWACLHHRSVFDSALRLAVRDLLPGRYWKRRLPVKALPGADLANAVKPLTTAISSHFAEQEGRGKACLVDYLKRGNLHHFFAYPEDFPASPLAWTAQGLIPHSYRPALEVVFVFDDEAGCVDIYCVAGMQTVQRLHSLFAETVIALRDLPDPPKPAYALEGLKSRNFQFIRPPDSPIRDVRLKRLGFAVLGRATSISIDTDPTANRFALHQETERVFPVSQDEAKRIALGQTKVINATLTATIDQGDGRRARTRTFDITTKSCSLKYDGHDLLLRQMLIASGIDLTGKPVAARGDSARPAA
jgi:hypothetical protein